MDSNFQETKYKRVYALRIKEKLKELGFEPILETDNVQKPGFKCWLYEASPAFLEAFKKYAYRKEE